ncbi:hypothetical protein FBU30_000411 [Linnemannia zychae]|nr:hypothetical protein FBU30_000411 [Linnemannia zychae]
MEKKETHRKPNAKRVRALMAAEVAINTLSERISRDKPPTKVMFKNVDKNMQGAFTWSLQDREDFVDFLIGQQQDARLCRTEADIAIAADCQVHDIVLSQDPDFFAYESRNEVKVLEYNKVSMLTHIGLSTTQFTALASISSNDYNENIPSLGITTNYKVIKDLPDGDVPFIVQEYLKSPQVAVNNQDEIDLQPLCLCLLL